MTEFTRYGRLASMINDYVAVCRCQHGDCEMFHIPFENEKDLMDFIRRNDGDCDRIGFYAVAYVKQKAVTENT